MDLSIIALVVHFLISIWPKTNIIEAGTAGAICVTSI